MMGLKPWERLEVKDSDYRNHPRFTLRCISKDLIPASVRLKLTSNIGIGELKK